MPYNICGKLHLWTVNADERPAQSLVLNTGKPADWPKDQDAVVSAKKNHIILLENDTVRVLDVTVLPGEKEALHHHQWPSVLYIMEGGDFIDRDGEGNVLFDSRKTPMPKLPFTTWTGPEALHSIENLSKTQSIRLIRVEIKK